MVHKYFRHIEIKSQKVWKKKYYGSDFIKKFRGGEVNIPLTLIGLIHLFLNDVAKLK